MIPLNATKTLVPGYQKYFLKLESSQLLPRAAREKLHINKGYVCVYISADFE